MKNIFCPNLSNPQVKSEFEELKSALGSEDLAYLVWNKNNGYAIDHAPNGAQSQLFRDLENKLGGNRTFAIRQKSYLYMSEFSEGFGRWYENSDTKPFIYNTLKYDGVDENGEPVLSKPSNYKNRTKAIALNSIIDSDLFTKHQYSDEIMKDLLQADLIDDSYKTLAISLSRHNIPIRITNSDNSTLMSTYIDENNACVIVINKNILNNVSNRYAANKLMHEIVHAITVEALTPTSKYYNEALDKASQRMMKAMNKAYPEHLYSKYNVYEFQYALQDKFEFVAQFITDPYVMQQVFNGVKILDQKTKGRGFLNALKSFINKIISVFTNSKTNEQFAEDYKSDLLNFILNKESIQNGNIKFSQQLREIYNAIDNDRSDIEQLDTAITYGDKVVKAVRKFDFKFKNFIADNINYKTRDQIIAEQKAIENKNKPSQLFLEDTDLDRQTKLICDEIIKDLQIRAKAVNATVLLNSEEKEKTLQGINSQISSLSVDMGSKITNVVYFMDSIMPVIVDQYEDLRSRILRNLQDKKQLLSSSEYMYQKHDTFGVYKNIFNTIGNLFQHPMICEYFNTYKAQDGSLIKDIKEFREKLAVCSNLCDQVDGLVNMALDIQLKNKIIGVAVEAGAPSEDLNNALYVVSEKNSDHDVSSLFRSLGSVDNAKDFSLRMLSKLVVDATNEANKRSSDKAFHLLQLAADIKRNGLAQKDFYEYDKDGLPTGNLIRRYNYGQFERDYRNFLKFLNAHISADPRCDQPLEPDNNVPPSDPDLGLKWNLLKEDWLAHHCERRFSSEYYKKFAKISKLTKTRRDEIQALINQARAEFWDDNTKSYNYDDMKDPQWQKLKTLYMQKKQLASLYDVNGLKKEGDDLQVAQELQELNKALYSGSKAKRDEARWKAKRDKKIAECGGVAEMNKGRGNSNFNWKDLDKWDERNSRRRFKMTKDGEHIQLFEDLKKEKQNALKKMGYSDKDIDSILNKDDKYRENKDYINALLQPYRNVSTGEVDANIVPERIKQIVNKKQKENSELMHSMYSSSSNKKVREVLKKINEKYYTTKWTTQLQEAYEKAMQEFDKSLIDQGVDPSQAPDLKMQAITNFMTAHGTISTFMDSGGFVRLGKFTPYQYYSKIEPIDEEKYIEYTPGDNYIESDESSDFINKNFEDGEDEPRVPKAAPGRYSLKENGKEIYTDSFNYDNQEAYDKVKDTEFYKNIKDTLSQVRDIYSNIPYMSRYQLPGISGSTYRFMAAAVKSHKWHLALQQFTRLYSTTEKDIDFKNAISRRPDGHSLNFVRQPFTRRLDDPSVISIDLAGIVCLYYHQAQLFEEKQKIKDDCEAILDVMRKTTYGNSEKNTKVGELSNTFQMAESFVNMHVYGNQEAKVEAFGINFSKIFNKLKAYGTWLNLALSPKVTIVGFVSAQYVHLMNAITGQKYNFIHDWTIGQGFMIKSLLLSGLGARTFGKSTRLEQQNLMELFNIAEQGEKKYRHTNRIPAVNAITENWSFGGLTMCDYIVKGSILNTTLAAHRFFRGEFVAKQDIENRFHDRKSFSGGEEYKKALKEWKSGETLFNVLHEAHKNGTKDNAFNISSKYKDAFEKSYSFIRQRAANYGANADGVMTPTQKAQFMASTVGAAVMMHRQYLQPMLQSYYGAKKYNLETREYQYGYIRAIIDLFAKPIYDAVHAETILSYGTNKKIDKVGFGGRVRVFGKSLKGQIATTLVDPINRRAVKRVIIEVAIYNAILSPLVTMLLNMADDDKDDKLLQLLAYIAISSRWEIFNAYRTGDIISNIKSATALTSVWDALNTFSDNVNSILPEGALWSVLSNFWGEQSTDITNNNEDTWNEIVERGTYEGWTKGERSLFKFTAFKNMYEQLENAYAKRKYMQNQIYRQEN